MMTRMVVMVMLVLMVSFFVSTIGKLDDEWLCELLVRSIIELFDYFLTNFPRLHATIMWIPILLVVSPCRQIKSSSLNSKLTGQSRPPWDYHLSRVEFVSIEQCQMRTILAAIETRSYFAVDSPSTNW